MISVPIFTRNNKSNFWTICFSVTKQQIPDNQGFCFGINAPKFQRRECVLQLSRQHPSAFGSSSCQDSATGFSAHTLQKAVLIFSFSITVFDFKFHNIPIL